MQILMTHNSGSSRRANYGIRQRHEELDAGTFTRSAVNFAVATDLGQPGTEVAQAVAGGGPVLFGAAGDALGIKAGAVVRDDEFETAGRELDRHAHFVGPGMAYRIVQAFLEGQEQIMPDLRTDG